MGSVHRQVRVSAVFEIEIKQKPPLAFGLNEKFNLVSDDPTDELWERLPCPPRSATSFSPVQRLPLRFANTAAMRVGRCRMARCGVSRSGPMREACAPRSRLPPTTEF